MSNTNRLTKERILEMSFVRYEKMFFSIPSIVSMLKSRVYA